MAQVTLEIGGNRWPVACRDGEEEQLRRLGAMLDARWEDAQRASGDAGASRVMLLVALMLADDLSDLQATGAATAGAGAGADEAALGRLADRLEAVADALENPRTDD